MAETEEKEYSAEELKAMRDNMHNFYKQQIPMLKLQHQYEQLLADIEEARAKRLTMSIRIAQMMAGPAKGPEGLEEEDETMHRNPDGSPADIEEKEAPVKKEPRKLKQD